jgi:hypothetical protein
MTYLTRDDFIRIACEAGIDKYLNTNGHLIGNLLERFGQKVVYEIAAAEREACAKVCDGWPDYNVQGLAEAIRARSRSEALTNLNKAAEDMGKGL